MVNANTPIGSNSSLNLLESNEALAQSDETCQHASASASVEIESPALFYSPENGSDGDSDVTVLSTSGSECLGLNPDPEETPRTINQNTGQLSQVGEQTRG